MIIDFRTASVAASKLNPFIQSILDERQHKPCPPVHDLLSKYPASTPENSSDLRKAVTDTIDLAELIGIMGHEIFDYPHGKIPHKFYYAIIAGGLIESAPQHFPNLPGDYAQLSSEIYILVETPSIIGSKEISEEAKFCYKILTLDALHDFLKELREGKISPSDPETIKFYDKLLRPTHQLAKHNDDLTQSIFDLVQKTSFIFNHFDNDLCHFIAHGMQSKEDVLDKEKMFELVPEGRTSNTLRFLEAAYQTFINTHGEQNYDLYYDFCEKVVTPARLLFTFEPDAAPILLDYMLGTVALTQCGDRKQLLAQFGGDIVALYNALSASVIQEGLLKNLQIERTHLQSAKACIAISDIVFRTLKMSIRPSSEPNWNEEDEVPPLYSGDDMTDLYNKLSNNMSMEIGNPHLRNLWRASCSKAIQNIEKFTCDFPESVEELGLYPRSFDAV